MKVVNMGRRGFVLLGDDGAELGTYPDENMAVQMGNLFRLHSQMQSRAPQAAVAGNFSARANNPVGTRDARFGELGKLDRPDGDVSTEISITVTDPRINNGRPTNIPTLVQGQNGVDDLVAGKEPTRAQVEHAIQRAVTRQQAGEYLPGFDSIKSAVAAAEERSAEKGNSVAYTQDPARATAVSLPSDAQEQARLQNVPPPALPLDQAMRRSAGLPTDRPVDEADYQPPQAPQAPASPTTADRLHALGKNTAEEDKLFGKSDMQGSAWDDPHTRELANPYSDRSKQLDEEGKR